MAYQGKGITVWNLPDNPGDLISAAGLAGVDWIEFKIHDGSSAWSGRGHVTPAYVTELRKHFHEVNGWGFSWTDGVVNGGDRGDGVPELEAAAATSQMRALELDNYSADWEESCEAHPDLVERFCTALNEGWQGIVGGPANVARQFGFWSIGWANLFGHPAYPSSTMGRYVEGYRPMIYRPTFQALGVDGGGNSRTAFATPSTLFDTRVYFEGKPFSPIVSVFEGTKTDLATDLAWIRQNCHGVSAWEFTGCRPANELYQIYSRLEWHAGQQAAADPYGPVFKAAGDLVNAGNSEGVLVQDMVRWFKGEISREQLIGFVNAR